jgi:aerobic-type carbon monoxide dehydrogenase small subunit (CoxS/CutS family)
MTTLRVNGQEREVRAPPNIPLLNVLRDDLGLTGTRYGCGRGQCGACFVLADGAPVASCLTTLSQAEGLDIVTIEGLARGDVLHPVQEAFVREDAMQCGYCTSGMIISAVALLEADPAPTAESVAESLAGNLCRCGVYGRAIRAVLRAAGSSA